ncbi:c-type cytochrome [Dyadobacter flavalbus]|uniref:C-type cytochrome n=1 Tax=Dyadobacter flavalbus TaxID=2579942 RepID=A0A5M8QT68_9BACT|nr:c-type cytochrome [Dyadobacter flavalbus]KAA6439319.1 c-type cytochrome [Dyadobacter flavalbus]
MKFRNYLETIAGISIYPLISLLIFFVFFVSLLVFVFRMDNKTLRKLESMPLNDGVIKKGLLSIAVLLMISASAFAQAPEEKPQAITGIDIMLYLLLIVSFFVAIQLIITLASALRTLNKFTQNQKAAQGKTVETVSWWKKFAGMSVLPADEKHLIIEGHNYDGIHELDNGMPPWLQSLFAGTIVIAIAYFAYYYSGIGDFQLAELDKEMAQAEIDKKIYMEKVGASMDENNVTQLTDPSVIGEGKKTFQEKCSACHGMDGGGTVGPNLTDNYWLHGTGIKNIFKTVKYGVPEKGMISWEKQLSPTDIQKVASYILSLKGSKPANPKEPQGELMTDEKIAANGI